MSVNVREIEEQAIRWAVRLDREGTAGAAEESGRGAAEEPALDAWLASDPRCPGALLRAQAALSYLDRGRALSGVVPRPERPSLWTRRGVLMGGASVGALAGTVGAISIGLLHARRYTTELGEVRRVPFADGSVATLNTESELEVALEDHVRQVSLGRGEAWFQVTPDAKRPFVVRAGRVRVRAVGTAFSVRRLEAGADVLVSEGVVEAWVEGAEQHRTALAAGSRATVTESGVRALEEPPSAIERTLAWRDGEIALEGETLEAAVAEFNRYNARKLVIADPLLGQERLVGQFRTTEPEAFARAVRSTLGAQVLESNDALTFSRAPSR